MQGKPWPTLRSAPLFWLKMEMMRSGGGASPSFCGRFPRLRKNELLALLGPMKKEIVEVP
jgi:hypothetical protein